MVYLLLASILATAGFLRLRRSGARAASLARPLAVDRMISLLGQAGLRVSSGASGVVSHGSIHSIDADSVVPARAFGEADRIQIRMLVTASSAFGGLVGARWQEGAGPSVSHRELMRQLGRATADWRSGAGGRGVVVDPAGLRIEPFLFDLTEVVLPILREEPDRLAASIRDAGRRRIEPAVGRGLRAF